MPKRHTKKHKKTFPWWRLLLTLSVIAAGCLIYLDAQVRYSLNERQWQMPARVYARPLIIEPKRFLQADDVAYELKLLGYRQSSDWRVPGHYRRNGGQFWVSSRGADLSQLAVKPTRFLMDVSSGRVARLTDAGGRPLSRVVLEPLPIGSIYPRHREDRVLVQLNEVPASLREILLLIEDRDFYQHFGLSPKSIARAALANAKAGRTVQGGSTITQQLVKNVFLTRSRSLSRKAVEATMSLLVEAHYSKDQILESYLNEVYLGQEGPRAIHGFALASQHYFNRPLSELTAEQVALLVGMVKGPSYYDPWRHPKRAKERRNVVLSVMAKHDLISADQLDYFQRSGLGLSKSNSMAAVFPAYLDLVRRQLRRDYSDRDLQTQGMQVLTAFDPIVQRHAEQSMRKVTDTLDAGIEGAMVVTAVGRGDIVALVGGRRMRYAGFNRALDAVRQTGSLIKPAVYLAALEQPSRYTLATPISDGPVEVQAYDGTVWQPRNFDHKSHGPVLLHKALAHSYNQATARLGMELGLPVVSDVVTRLGVQRPQKQVPAMLLGAGALSPLEVAQMYQTIAAGGLYRPLRAINEVADHDGELLVRYPSEPTRVVDASTMHLLHYSMIEVVREGTGKSVYQQLPEDFAVAGKTGTTNDLRDSWFAGFAGDYLAVTWLGRDDNKSAGLTGASGALKVWRGFFASVSRQALDLEGPPGVVYRWVDGDDGGLSSRLCDGSRYLPFIQGSAPQHDSRCAPSLPGVLKWFQNLF